MERFINGTEECIVLIRSGETALIVRPGNELTPFIVPLQHIKGKSDWWQGKYFCDFESAYSYYKSVVNNGLCERLRKEVEYAKASYSTRDLLFQAHGRIAMALELELISVEEYLALNHECVAEGINNPKYFDKGKDT